MRRWSAALIGLALVLALVALARPVAAAPALQTMELMAELRGGAEEVPTPGDPDGTGTAMITLDMGSGQISYTINASNITLPAAAAHIHEGERGVAGPVVVPLTPPAADGTVTGTAPVDAALMQRIQQNPAGFYVNVHTSDFPNGAVRGQLMMAGDTAGGTGGNAGTTGGTAGTTGGTGGTAGTTGGTAGTTGGSAGAAGGTTPATLPSTGSSDDISLLLLGLAALALSAGLGLRLTLRREDSR